MTPWKEVATKPEYMNLSQEQKLAARQQYFNEVVAPRAPKDKLNVVRSQFNEYANSLDATEKHGSFFSDVLHGAKRMAGVAFGAVNSPLAFIWGSQAEQFEKPEEYKDLPWHQMQLKAIGAGLDSAWKSISEEGNWGTLYGEYYKSVTGDTIRDSLIKGVKADAEKDSPNTYAAKMTFVDMAAPTVEALANIITDPLITLGEARKIAQLKLPKNFIGRIKDPRILADIEKIEKLEGAEKAAVQSRLLEALENRRDYMKWWEDALAEGDKIGPPLLKPGERSPRNLTAPQSAMSGSPAREFASKSARVEPDISRQAREGTILGKTGRGSEASGKRVVALEKANKLRAQKGLEPLKPASKEQIAAQRKAAALENINKFRKSRGLSPYSAKAAGGAILGIEEDENGNIQFNVKKALLGTVLVAGGIKTVGSRNTKKFLKTLENNPAWAKVHGMVGSNRKSFTFAGVLGRLNTKLFDRFAVLKKLSRPAYIEARTYNSYKDVAKIKFDELKGILKPVRNNEALVTSYIAAHRALTRAKRGLKNPNGVTLADAKAAIEEIESHFVKTGGKIEDLRGALNGFQQWTRKYILEEAYNSGIISEKSYQAILKNNEWYATFDVIDYLPDDMGKIPMSISGEYFSVANQDIIKGMIGTEKKIANPIEATVKKFVAAQATFARNKVASALVDDSNVRQLLRPVASTKKQFKIMQNMGLDPVLPGGWNKKNFDTITRFRNGVVERYLAPKEIADAMKQLKPAQVPRVIAGINNVFRSAATTVYLPFTISNAMRDALMAYTTSQVHGNAGRYVADWGRGFWEGAKHEFLGSSDLAREYIKAGGGFGYVGNLRSPNVAKAKLFRKSPARFGAEIISSPFKLIQKVSSTIELAPRVGTFHRAKMVGLDNVEAAVRARRSTIDFNRSGTFLRVANQWVPFLNARVQGRVTVGQALIARPAQTLSKVFVSTVVPGLAAYAWNRLYFSDMYDDIPEYITDNYFVLIYGKDKDKYGRTVPKYFTISKGDVGQMAMNPIEFGLDKAWEKDKDGTAKFLINYLSDLSPVDFAREGNLSFSKMASGLMPPIAKGVLENWANLNFYTGQEVVPYYTRKTKPPELQYKENTPKTYKWLGKKLGMSPLMLQNFASNVLAGYGREGLDPSAMVRGLTGRLIKSRGGAIEDRAWTAIKDIEQGYLYTRAYAEEMLKDGKRKEASRLIQEWNKHLPERIKEFNKEFGEHGLKDRGGLMRSYQISSAKIRGLYRKANRRNRRPAIEDRLRRK